MGQWKIIKTQWVDGITATTANTDFTHHVTFSQPLASSGNVLVIAQVVSYSNGFTVATSSVTTTGVDLVCNARDTWGHEVMLFVIGKV